jgi:hypothetical protein
MKSMASVHYKPSNLIIQDTSRSRTYEEQLAIPIMMMLIITGRKKMWTCQRHLKLDDFEFFEATFSFSFLPSFPILE